jgi:hypothetical protein
LHFCHFGREGILVFFYENHGFSHQKTPFSTNFNGNEINHLPNSVYTVSLL